MGIAERYLSIRAEVEDACIKSGRCPADCLLLAVSKTVGIDGVAQAIEAGAMDFGENRPDQLLEKHAAFPEARWHFIGNIQSRRIRDIVKCSHLIHSLYKLEHAEKINVAASEIGKVQDVLIEVNVSGEESKGGIGPEQVPGFLQACKDLDNICVRGLMTMAPQGDSKVAQNTFARLRRVKDSILETAEKTRSSLSSEGEPANSGQELEAFDQLSMGMSEDWREAIVEGSTIVRLGRAIFSEDF